MFANLNALFKLCSICENPVSLSRSALNLLSGIIIAAENIYFQFYFSEKIRLDISYESKTIHMNCQDIFLK